MSEPETLDQIQQPTGYVFDQNVIDSNVAAFGAMGVDLHTGRLNGTCERKIEQGIAYENLQDYAAEYLRPSDRQHTRTGRRILASGILEPILQATGICVGCGYSTAQWLAWVARYVLTGTGPLPQEVSLVAPYLLGRHNLRGNRGAYPSYSARGSHDVGVLTVEALARGMNRDVSTMTTRDQEDIAISLRDNPRFHGIWLDSMKPLTTRVFKPQGIWSLADCVASLYPVTVGMSSQPAETRPGNGSGISTWYVLRDRWGRPAGHETVVTGWFTLNGKLGLIVDQSWGLFGGSQWPGNRVTLQTDEGPKKLYEAQVAVWAADLWAKSPEPWAIGYAGGRD